MKQISFLLVLLCLSFAGYSQITAASYGFTASSGTFIDISSTGTYASSVVADDDSYTGIPIGFAFNYCGVDYYTLSACSNGWLSLGDYYGSGGVSRNNTTGNMATIANGAGILMANWDDLNGAGWASLPGSAYYTTIGTAPNRQFIFQWSQFEYYGAYGGGGYQDFEIVLNETSNRIDFIYNNGTMSGGYGGATIGIGGTTATDYQTISDVTSAPTSSSTSFVAYLDGSPANGQVYSFTPPPPCSGIPTAGTAVADIATACVTDNITLSLTGTTAATALTFQWQSSPDFSTWTDIPGGTTSTFVTTETADMYYRAIVICPASVSADTSTSTSVTFSSVCYCSSSLYYYSPAYYMYAGTLGLFDVTGEAGSTISDVGPASVPADGYENRTGISVDMQQGNTYSGTLNYAYTVYTYSSQIWIDYNDDGIFDVSEIVTPVINSGSYASSSPFSISVPITAPVGAHRMRVRYADLQYSSVPTEMDPCNNYDMSLGYSTTYYYGVTRDYTVNVLPAPACSGTPSGGTAVSSATLACPGTPFTLSSTGLTVAAGLTYQWQESATAGGPWTDISGATSPTYSYMITAPTYFQLVVNCPASSTSGTSTAVFVNYFGFCYCVPSYDGSPAGSYGYGLDLVDITGEAGSTLYDYGLATVPTNGYEDLTTVAAVNFQQGNSYSGTLYYSTGSSSYHDQIWIDFNDDGIFSASEAVTGVIEGGCSYVYSDAFTMNIPITATLGLHRMRIRNIMPYDCSTTPAIDPCASSDATYYYTYGQTRDYMANIIAAPACTGAPSGGTATSSTTLACPATTFTLTATGTTVASGLTYQWQESTTASGPWTDIAGATSTSYSYVISAPTYFQLVVSCPASGPTATAASTSVFVNYYGYCYCTPAYYYSPAGSYSYGLDIVDITGYSGSTLYDAGLATVPSNGYEDLTTVAPIDFQQGGAYSGTLNYSTGSSSYHNLIWIDFNDDGVFDASEAVTGIIQSGSYTYSDPFTINIPVTAATGLHRMRVRNIMTYSSSTMSSLDPCASYDASFSYYYGQTRDYMANIIVLPACTGAPVVGAANASPTSGGVSIPFTLTLPGLTMAAGLTFQWQSATSATGPWTDIAGATNTSYSFISIYNDMWYQCVVVCTLSTTTTTSTPAMITYVATPPCSPGSSSWSYAGGTYAGLDEFHVTGFGGSNLDDVGLNTVVSTTTGYLDHTAIAPITMEQGGVYASSGLWYNTYDHQELQVWVDFNDDGIYEPSEEVSPVSGFDPSFTSNPTNFNISIPTTGALGMHNMRVRAIWELYPGGPSAPLHLDPCNMSYLGTSPSYYSGDAIDYRVYIIPHCLFTSSAAAGPAVCPNSPFTLTGTTTAPTYSWSGPGGFTSTLLNPTVPGAATVGVYSFVATDGTCTLTMTATQPLLPTSPIPVVTPAPATVCNGSTVTLTAAVPGLPGTAILVEDFNAGLGSWTVDNTGSSSSSATSPWQGQPDGYTYGFGTTFHSPDNSAFVITNADAGGGGSTTVSSLISPAFSLTGFTAASLSFQHYLHAYFADNVVSVDISTDGGFSWSLIHDYATVTTGTPTAFVTDIYDLTPYVGTPNCMLRFYYNSSYGYYWALDNVSLTGTPVVGPAPVWTPVTNLFSDAALTTPYVAGTAAYEVYVHPTTVLSTTVTDYIASTTLGTCSSYDTSTVTITAPPAITASGSTNICAGNNVTLSHVTTGGTWSTSNTTVATVTAGGVVHGVAAGADTVFYTVGGCSTFTVVNVSTFVTVTTGSTSICSGGLTTTLSNPTTGGTWTSSNGAIATVNGSGVVTSGTTGSAIITYTLPTGCSDTSLVTSLAPPAAIGGGTSVCYNGGTTTLTETVPGGTWSTSTGTVATLSATTGSPITVTGLTAGTANITYTSPAGCFATVALTLNANPANITGTMSVCASGGATTLADATGSGTWSSGNVFRATVNSSGVVTGVTSGTVVMSYTAINGCFDTALVTVNALPSAITGTTTICNLASTTLADASTPGTWSTSTPSVTSVDAASGMVTALTSGSGTIIFTQTSTGCSRSTTVTVNALPGAISGLTSMCNNTTTTLSSSASGTWTSGSPLIASIESGTGIVHALSVGTANITLTNGSGCRAFSTMTVNPSFVPSIVLAANPGTTVCAGTTVTYTPTLTNGGTAPTYSWTVNGTPMSASSSYSYVPVTGDVVALNIVSNLTCAVPSTATSSLTMTVDPIVTPALTLATAHTDTGCAGAFTTVYTHPVSAGTGATFQWYVNGSPVSGTTNYTYLAAVGDVVTAVMTSTAGCLSGSTAVVTSASLTLNIIPFVVPNVTVSSSTGPNSCGGNVVVYSTTATNGGNTPAYLWTVNGVAVATGPGYFYIPNNGDMVVVRMTSNYPCVAPASDTAQMIMTVGTTVTPVATIAAHPGTTIALGMNDTFTVTVVSGGGAAPAYQWYINGVPVSGANGVTFITHMLVSGDLVTCHVTNTDLCGGTTISNVLAMSVIGSGGTGVNNVSGGEASISLVPNPNNGSFIVKGNLGLSTNEDMTLEVTNMLGQVVYTGHTEAKSGEFNEQVKLNGVLANGSYVLSVRSQHMNKIFHFVLEQK